MTRPTEDAHHHPNGFAGMDGSGAPDPNVGLAMDGASIGPLPPGVIDPFASGWLPLRDLAPAAAAGTASAGPSAPAVVAAVTAPAATPPTASAGLVIDVSYDSTVTGAPAEFTAAVTAAVNALESMFTNNVTLTIAVGWGEVNGRTITAPGVVGQSTSTGDLQSYTTVRNALLVNQISADQAAATAALPGSDPTGGGTGNDFYVSQAQEKALGIAVSSPSKADGAIGLAALSDYTFDPNTRAAPGQFDAIGVLEHEFTEVMGRTGALGVYDGAGIYTLLDLFRYTTNSQGAVVRQLAPGAGSFSVDGQTLLTQYNNPVSGGDATDWVTSLQGDSFGDANPGVAGLVTATDLREMNVLGYNLSAAATSVVSSGGANCFVSGTNLLTERGAVPIEHLRPGDRVVTRFAGLAPIVWIGHRRVAPATHPDPFRLRPVRIAPDAFGPGCPARALRLSPDHAVAIDGALVPIRLLVNGGSIAWDMAARRVTYWHVALARHDLLRAEELEAESFLDTEADSRGRPSLFAGPDNPAAQAMREALSCLPLRVAPAAVEPLWRGLAARSDALGHARPEIARTGDPALALRQGGRRIAPVLSGRGFAAFALPDGETPVWLLSRQVVPAALDPWREDRRRLGVRVRRLTLRAGAETTEIALDDPRLGPGWWAPEPEADAIWRWTDGAARLPVPLGGAVLEVALATPPAYPLA